MEKASKRFEEWEEIDCNDCSHYWDSSCDGASKGSKIGCNSYLATRSIVIPERLNSLEKRVKWLEIWNLIFMLLLALVSVVVYFNG